jgi:ATP-binding cassette subfamily B protein/subfamily B ATP-binding cassette protein MsbA
MQKYRQLLRYARTQRAFFLLILILTLLSSALLALQPWPMKVIVDHVLGQNPLPDLLERFVGSPSPMALLGYSVIGGLMLFLLSSMVEAVLTWSWTVAGRRMVYALAEDLYSRLQGRSLLYHSRHAVGDSMSRVTVDSWSVYHVLDTLLFSPGHALLTIIAMIYLMAHVDPTLTVMAVVVAPFMIGASFLVGRPLRAAAKLKRDIETRIQSHIQQTLTGIPVVQAFTQEDRERARFEHFADAAIRAQQRSTLVGGINSLSSGLITTLGTGAILWVGAQHVLGGTLTIGGILLFLVYLGSLQTQMKVFATIYTSLQGFSASVDRVTEVLRSDADLIEKAGAVQIKRAGGAIEFQNVTFGYEPGRPVLNDISLRVNPGETLAIVGPSGAGKTTVVNLVPRFFDPWQGRILIDDIDVREVKIQSVRQQVSLVLQEPFLFPVSIADNIAYAKTHASRDEIESAARVANAHDFIARLPHGYDTVLGERGATLSGGERQRLSIARAMLKDAPIVILDEPTSALDAQTERSLLDAIERLTEGRTTLVIAHRLSTVRRADRILVLEGGRIVDSGAHDKLLAEGGAYARYYHLQFKRSDGDEGSEARTSKVRIHSSK